MNPASGKPEHTPPADIRSFGRRRGRKLSERQASLLSGLLPRVTVDLAQPAPVDLRQLFSPGMSAVWLEIGFGGAEHLIWQARANPDVGFIGCEPFEDGVVKALTAIDADGIGNLKLWGDDVRPLLRWLPDASLGRVFMLFPDPWPKVRHQKRRLFSSSLLAELGRVMVPGAELRLATDIGDYARTALLAVAETPLFRWAAEGPDDWRVRPDDWPGTRYEAKAVREGRQRYYFRFIRV
ncbi:tRNA (guanine(46)-N(7))-methyltransferase TrmB [Hyphomicrobium sp.]|uniref:tRNA (guanine(46)-N(7))-methyltransferase TrmB n=1 Tax=Hyphomicrobium sp. TaxID=82 RepID=UPI002B5B879C|nr:tRNA (guanine(46)-N(7))-methyltransferase TrmB [Hyphomicrobium sp.]HRN88210.1 tRNA (guanine(46)-N(7))-methyltransferase TrmB [Hyphomicrobium sp.]HRQ28416.1 tRNA (guanine(46)-N(7))-methyltransferase TrmB [Hyphomicrobium sp.]